MPKKIRKSLHNSGAAIKNFSKWLPKSVINTVREIPSSAGRFKSWILTFRGSLTIICLIGIILYPIFAQNEYHTQVIIYALIFSIFAASWDFLAGFTGQVSFGQSAFFGISAYITVILFNFYGFPWVLSLFLGAISGVISGLLIGIPCLRLKGPYLALGTQSFTLILLNLFTMSALQDIFYGSEGIYGIPAITDNIFIFFVITLIFMIVSFVCMILIVNSNFGTVLKAIRDDETAADASGINTTKYKLAAFMISGFFAGIAGALFALNNRAVNPSVYQPLYSFYAIIMAAIGGIATISGSLIGAFLFMFLSEFLRPLAATAILIFAATLILIIRFQERGILNPVLDRLKEFYDFLRGR